MSASRENPKGFRARMMKKCGGLGLTVETQLAQNLAVADLPSIRAGGNVNERINMLHSHENKKDSRAETGSKFVTFDADQIRDIGKADNSGYHVDTGLAWKASNADMPRLSEAMANRNWRNPRRNLEGSSTDTMGPLWSAPPGQSKFPDEVKIKPRRHDEDEVMNFDHGLTRVAYRGSRPQEVKPELIPYMTADSVSADLCLSAPATKTEFSAAEIGTNERSAKFAPSIFQPAIKSVVRLDTMTPTNRAAMEKILNWDQKDSGPKGSRRRDLRESSSLTSVSLTDGSFSSWDSVEFPLAEIRPAKDDMQFEIKLNDVETTLRNRLCTLVEPQTAGLPPEYLEKEYEEICEERRRTKALIEENGRQGGVEANKCMPGNKGADDPKFNDLLRRLNRLCAPRLSAFTPTTDASDGCPALQHRDGIQDPGKDEPVESNHKPRQSKDSAVSDMPPMGRKRASTLNPKAEEFCCTKVETPQPDTTVKGPGQGQASERTTESAAQIQQLETRVAELEARIAQAQAKGEQVVPPQRSSKGSGMNDPSYGYGNYGSVAVGGGIDHPAMNRAIQGPGGYQAGFNTSLPQQPPPAVGMGMNMNSTAAGIQNGPVFLHNGNYAGFTNPYNNAQATPSHPGNVAPVAARPAAGTPAWIKVTFGPKPVAKPNRPFHPGDRVQATRQLEYEEYLEHLRSTQTGYAQLCKRRQANRAGRERIEA